MSDLEELGYLEQPHTSAGRIPSSRGYRYYVDCLMEPGEASADEMELIRRTYERRVREVGLLVRETARLLAETTHLAAVVTGPQSSQATIKDARLIPMGDGRVILIYVTDSGIVENHILEMPSEITLIELQRISGTLMEHLRGVRLQEISRTTLQELYRELQRYQLLLDQIFETMSHEQVGDERQRLMLGGATHILQQPEFRDVDKVRALLAALEDEHKVGGVLGEGQETRGVVIQIGEEIRLREMQDCSMVSATYRIGDRVVGRIGVIGPRRMEYPRVVRIVDEVVQRLNENLGRGRPL